jgi:RNA polymerase sigma factor (sigma-70 family)
VGTKAAGRLDPISDLYSSHHGWLYAWLRKKLGCAHQAADLAHDTYVRVISSGRLPQPEQSRAFLTQVAKHLVIDMYRRHRLEQAYQETVAALPQLEAPSVEARVLMLETLFEIDAMLGNMPPKVREAFLMSQLEGMTYAEIAARLDVTVSSVQKYMSRALCACYQIAYA